MDSCTPRTRTDGADGFVEHFGDLVEAVAGICVECENFPLCDRKAAHRKDDQFLHVGQFRDFLHRMVSFGKFLQYCVISLLAQIIQAEIAGYSEKQSQWIVGSGFPVPTKFDNLAPHFLCGVFGPSGVVNNPQAVEKETVVVQVEQFHQPLIIPIEESGEAFDIGTVDPAVGRCLPFRGSEW